MLIYGHTGRGKKTRFKKVSGDSWGARNKKKKKKKTKKQQNKNTKKHTTHNQKNGVGR